MTSDFADGGGSVPTQEKKKTNGLRKSGNIKKLSKLHGTID